MNDNYIKRFQNYHKLLHTLNHNLNHDWACLCHNFVCTIKNIEPKTLCYSLSSSIVYKMLDNQMAIYIIPRTRRIKIHKNINLWSEDPSKNDLDLTIEYTNDNNITVKLCLSRKALSYDSTSSKFFLTHDKERFNMSPTINQNNFLLVVGDITILECFSLA